MRMIAITIARITPDAPAITLTVNSLIERIVVSIF